MVAHWLATYANSFLSDFQSGWVFVHASKPTGSWAIAKALIPHAKETIKRRQLNMEDVNTW
jgi:hypothetical protein